MGGGLLLINHSTISSMPRTVEPLGGLTTFNIHHGFSEALVRGMRSGFLTDQDYHHLTQCENLEVCSFCATIYTYINLFLWLCIGC